MSASESARVHTRTMVNCVRDTRPLYHEGKCTHVYQCRSIFASPTNGFARPARHFHQQETRPDSRFRSCLGRSSPCPRSRRACGEILQVFNVLRNTRSGVPALRASQVTRNVLAVDLLLGMRHGRNSSACRESLVESRGPVFKILRLHRSSSGRCACIFSGLALLCKHCSVPMVM
jgi:hypothetical protein